MNIKPFAVRAVAAGILSIALTVGTTELASATPLKQPQSITPASAGYYLSTNDIQVTDLDLLPEFSDDQLALLDDVVRTSFEEQIQRGEVAYSLNEDGSAVFSTEIPVGDHDVPVEIVYELEQRAPGMTELSRTTRSHHAASSGGNEWYPKIWFGRDSHGRWIRFNRAAQNLLISAGGTAAKAAICAIPGVNAAGCGLVWVASIAAKQVMKRHGRCPTRAPWLYAYPGNIRASQCRAR